MGPGGGRLRAGVRVCGVTCCPGRVSQAVSRLLHICWTPPSWESCGTLHLLRAVCLMGTFGYRVPCGRVASVGHSAEGCLSAGGLPSPEVDLEISLFGVAGVHGCLCVWLPPLEQGNMVFRSIQTHAQRVSVTRTHLLYPCILILRWPISGGEPSTKACGRPAANVSKTCQT